MCYIHIIWDFPLVRYVGKSACTLGEFNSFPVSPFISFAVQAKSIPIQLDCKGLTPGILIEMDV